MDPRDFQKFALMLATSSQPAQLRSAVSRSYYAVFNLGSMFLEKNSFTVPKNAYGHEEVVRLLSNSGSQVVEQIGVQLNDLRTRRQHADYRLDKQDIQQQKTVKTLVKQADRMIAKLDSQFTGPGLPQIIRAMKAYKQKIATAYKI